MYILLNKYFININKQDMQWYIYIYIYTYTCIYWTLQKMLHKYQWSLNFFLNKILTTHIYLWVEKYCTYHHVSYKMIPLSKHKSYDIYE